jgi:hypothetical protein
MKKNTGRNSGRMAMKSWSSNRTPVELMAKRAARKYGAALVVYKGEDHATISSRRERTRKQQ